MSFSRQQIMTWVFGLSLVLLEVSHGFTPMVAAIRQPSVLMMGLPNKKSFANHHHLHHTPISKAADAAATRDMALAVSSTSGDSDSSLGAAAEGSSVPNESDDEVFKGRLLLCLVALLYGTLNVSLRLVYQLPDPPSAAALSASRGWLASVCFLPLVLKRQQQQQQQQNSSNDDNGNVMVIKEEQQQEQQSSSKMDLFKAGLELAVWNFLAQGLLNVGLLSTGSARASFLTQTSVVLTPVLSLLFGQTIPKVVWLGCAVALGGLTLLSSGGGDGGLSLAFSSGDWIVLGGALSWSCYLLRLSQIGGKFNEINLQAVKTTLLAVLYSVWFITTYTPGVTPMAWVGNLAAWGALFYSALGPGMLADVLQQQGQKHVSASEANVLLSTEPVFAAICARLLLGEVTSLPETIGGGLILLAALIATR